MISALRDFALTAISLTAIGIVATVLFRRFRPNDVPPGLVGKLVKVGGIYGAMAALTLAIEVAMRASPQ